jgi:nicotinic acid mononucleotide adenylyltransferase/nicotinamide mononucleotide (NMN) deamidase PncC
MSANNTSSQLDRQPIVSALHSCGRQAVIAVTGGGSLAISDLLGVPGASAFLLEARVPYSPAALTEWLGREPEQCCSRETALAMAVVSWQRANKLFASPDEAVGVGCTAALVSNRPKRGEHRAWIATHTANATRLVGLSLAKGMRDRVSEERLVADALLRLLSDTCGLASFPELSLRETDSVTRETCVADPLLAELVAGRRATLWSVQSEWSTEPPVKPVGLLAGAFNPLHDGHRELARIAERRLGGSVAFELAWVNVDKPPLDFLTIEARCRQFSDCPVVLTHEPTFVRKSRLFPDTTFVVGIDTAERIVQPKYYGSEADMLAALDEIRSHGCRFLVAGRREEDRFRTLSDLKLPSQARDLFDEILETEFRRDISSTELRQQHS